METNKEEIVFDHYYFKRPLSKYSNDINPIKEYLSQSSTFLAKKFKLEKDVAVKAVKEILKKKGFIVPTVRYRDRDEIGNVTEKECSLVEYIKDTIDNNEVIVPSFTTYIHPSKKKSLHADFLAVNIKKRKEDKHNAFKYKQLGDTVRENFYTVLQKVRKIANNSLSGSYASASTILYNPSAHYTLTSMTRCIASIGNSISESIIAGNKHIRDQNSMINYINSIVTNSNKTILNGTIAIYKLHIPTPEEIMDMLLYSSRRYWKDEIFENKVYEYVKTLEDHEKVAVMYTNDLWHLKKYNNDLVKNMILELGEKKTGETDNIEYLTKSPEGITTLAHIICSKEIKGKEINYEKMKGTEELYTLCSTSKNILRVLDKYKRLLRTFLTTDILPINIAYIREMIRDSIVLSDTDSTCGSYDQWVDWILGDTYDSEKAACISAVVMTINTQAMDHNIKILAKNMNIQNELVDLLKMKNEFYWDVFTATNVNKHYYANVLVQEGNVFKEPDLEIKGVQLLASFANQDYINEIKKMIIDINQTVSKGEKIDLVKYIKKVADMEREILDKIKQGDTSIFRRDKIKSSDSYKSDLHLSPYAYHMLWEEVFSEKYGSAGIPTYMVVKIPLTTDSKKKMEEFINNIEDTDIKEKLSNFCKKYNKPYIGTLKPSISILNSKGIPSEIVNIIDTDRIIKDNLNPAYMVLETLGFYLKDGKLLYQLGY